MLPVLQIDTFSTFSIYLKNSLGNFVCNSVNYIFMYNVNNIIYNVDICSPVYIKLSNPTFNLN